MGGKPRSAIDWLLHHQRNPFGRVEPSGWMIREKGDVVWTRRVAVVLVRML